MMSTQGGDEGGIDRRTLLKRTAVAGVGVTGLTAASSVVRGQASRSADYVLAFDALSPESDWDYNDFVALVSVSTTNNQAYTVEFTPIWQSADADASFNFLVENRFFCGSTRFAYIVYDHVDESIVDSGGGQIGQEQEVFFTPFPDTAEAIDRRSCLRPRLTATLRIVSEEPCELPLPTEAVVGTGGMGEDTEIFFSPYLEQDAGAVGKGDLGMRILRREEGSGFVRFPKEGVPVWEAFEGVEESEAGEPTFVDLHHWNNRENVRDPRQITRCRS